ncbi:hypothetical protein B0T16DRAFT_427585 [Cercophora newfieldiana]|uniref:DUF1772-domain-containing protein n=1 Tax=Cercophora newfieldiana TaxID=92897 RepID=A0AA40CR86_9PEZI|nr:hypothetical protein B0T16DRAFT_427585 [Cercophora newfieldiana]
MTVSDALRFISILACTIHTGSQFSLSFVSGAALLASPTTDEATLLSQFRVIFRRGFLLCPMFAFLATFTNLGNAFITWRSDESSTALRFLLAALCSISLVPFTLLFVVHSEGLLLEKAAEKPGKGNASSAARTRELIGEWAQLNYVRTLFPLIGALIAYSAR